MNDHLASWLVLAAVLPAGLCAWAATWLLRWLAPRWGLLDRPGVRKVHSQPVPLGGGVAIWSGVVFTFALLQAGLLAAEHIPAFAERLPTAVREHVPGLSQESVRLWCLLGVGSSLLVLGLIDDFRGLPWQLRLLWELAVAAATVSWLDVRLTAFIEVPLVTWACSVMWIVILINSFNMLDNMDALSGGIAAIVSALLAAVLLLSPLPSSQQPQWFVGGFLLVLCGAVVGFLWHNRPPARIFMGDAGAYFIGYCIAVATLLSTYTSYHATSTHAVATPLCVLAVPLYDLLTVLWIRRREGRSPFHADKSHFSHRLVELGMRKGQAVLTIYLTTATCGLGALLLPRVDAIGAAIVLLLVVCILALIAILEGAGRRKDRG